MLRTGSLAGVLGARSAEALGFVVAEVLGIGTAAFAMDSVGAALEPAPTPWTGVLCGPQVTPATTEATTQIAATGGAADLVRSLDMGCSSTLTEYSGRGARRKHARTKSGMKVRMKHTFAVDSGGSGNGNDDGSGYG